MTNSVTSLKIQIIHFWKSNIKHDWPECHIKCRENSVFPCLSHDSVWEWTNHHSARNKNVMKLTFTKSCIIKPFLCFELPHMKTKIYCFAFCGMVLNPGTAIITAKCLSVLNWFVTVLLNNIFFMTIWIKITLFRSSLKLLTL